MSLLRTLPAKYFPTYCARKRGLQSRSNNYISATYSPPSYGRIRKDIDRKGSRPITLNRPDKRNALKRQFIEEIHQGVTELAADESLRVLVLQAEGKVFCAGMDLGEMQQRAESENGKAEWQRDSEVYGDLLIKLLELEVPTIAVLQGPVLAGGVGMVLATDMVVASDQMFFMLPEPMRGIVASMVTPLLIHRVGPGPASYMLLSGERVAAPDALRLGLCHAVVPPDQLQARVDQLLAGVLTGSKSALAITKKHISNCLASDLAQQVRSSMDVSAQARETADAREGLAAFLEKRKPNWQSE